MATYNWDQYLQKFNNLSAYDLYNKIKSQYGDISKVVSQLEDYARKNIAIDDTNQYSKFMELVNTIKKKYNEWAKIAQTKQYMDKLKKVMQKYNNSQVDEKTKQQLKQLYNMVKNKYWNWQAGQDFMKWYENKFGVESLPTNTPSITLWKDIKPPKLWDNPSEYDIGFRAGYESGAGAFISKFNDYKNYVDKILENFKNVLWEQKNDILNIKSRLDLFNTKLNVYKNILDTKQQIWDKAFETISSNIENLSKQYQQTYWKIMDRIKNYENLVNKTFQQMKDRLNLIWEWYEKALKFSQAAAASAAEKTLRWVTGKWAALRVANYLQNLAMKGEADLAKLRAQLAEQLNALDTSYLQLKNAIMQDKNLTDREKQNLLGNIEARMSALTQLKSQLDSGLVGEAAKPYLEEMAYQEWKINAIEQEKLKQKLTELDSVWKMKSPVVRQQVILSFLEKIDPSIKITDEVIKKALEAPDLISALKILRDEVGKQSTSLNNALTKLLMYFANQKQSWWNTQETNTSKLTIAQKLNNPWNILGTWEDIAKSLGAEDIVQWSNWYKYLKFKTPEDWFRAMKQLLLSDSYKNLSVADALKKWVWNDNPVHLKVAQQFLGKDKMNMKVWELSRADLFKLLMAIAKSEWFFKGMGKEQIQQFIKNLYNKLK